MKKVHSLFMTIIVVFIFSQIAGCTTATYGNKMMPVGKDDIYTMRIYVGGPIWVGESGSLPRVKKEAEKFMKEHPEYTYFEVIDSKRNAVPSYYEYKIKYYKSEEDSMIFQKQEAKVPLGTYLFFH